MSDPVIAFYRSASMSPDEINGHALLRTPFKRFGDQIPIIARGFHRYVPTPPSESRPLFCALLAERKQDQSFSLFKAVSAGQANIFSEGRSIKTNCLNKELIADGMSAGELKHTMSLWCIHASDLSLPDFVGDVKLQGQVFTMNTSMTPYDYPGRDLNIKVVRYDMR